MKIRSAKYNVILNIIYTVTGMIFPLITFPYASRVLDVEGMGVVSFFQSVSNYAIILASLGISTYGIRVTAKVRDDPEKLSQVTIELEVLNLMGTAAAIAILYLLAAFIPKFHDNIPLLTVNCILVFASGLGMNWLYSGLEQYTYITVRSLIFRIISFALVFVFVRSANDYVAYAAITAFASAGSYFLNFFYARKFIKGKIVRKLNLKRHLKPMLVLFASTLAINIYTNLDTVMLGFICGDHQVGLYTVAVKVKTILLSLIYSISAALLPRMSFYYDKNDKEAFGQILSKSITLVLKLSIPLVCFFILASRNTILFLGGEKYLSAIPCMIVLMPILVLSGFSNITGNQILIPEGKENRFMEAVIVGSIVDFGLNFLLMPALGCVGAAVATAFAELSQMLIQLKYAWKEIKENFNTQSFVKIIIASLVSSLALFVLLRTNYSVSSVLINVIIEALMFFIIYGVILIISKESLVMEILNDVLKRKRR